MELKILNQNRKINLKKFNKFIITFGLLFVLKIHHLIKHIVLFINIDFITIRSKFEELWMDLLSKCSERVKDEFEIK